MSSMSISSLSMTLLVIQQQLTRYVYSAYLIFGITGGCLNILLFSQRQYRTISCCTYFLVASLLMLFNLSLGAGSILYTLNHANPSTTIVAFCKSRFYLLQSSAMVYRWCLVLAFVDRYALSSTNARIRNFAQVSIARRVVSVIVPASFILSIHMLIFYDIRSGICGVVYSIIASIYHSIFTIVIGILIPVTIMIACALLIHRNLVRKRQRRQQTTIETTNRKNKEERLQRKRDQQVLIMLLIQAIIFALFTTPLLTYNFYTAATIFVTNKSPDRLAIERFAAFLSEMMMLFFTACSFYLHTLVSRTFRTELVRVLASTFFCNRFLAHHRIEPTTNDGTSITARKNNSTLKTVAQVPPNDQNILTKVTRNP